jgi:hypothetical protein
MTLKKLPNLRRTRDGFGGDLRAGICGAVNRNPDPGQAIGAGPAAPGDDVERGRDHA